MFPFCCRRVAIVLALFALFGSAMSRAAGTWKSRVSSSAGLARTQTGIDVLEAENFAPLRGKRVGFITNQTGVDSAGRRTIDLLAHAKGVKLVALFSPEHGIRGRMDASVSNATDAATGLPIYSLYGATRRPSPEMLANLDALVFDIQDAGVRFYTFITTMSYCMEAAAKQHIAFFVLDRPDPLGGEIIEGPMLDRDKLSFVGYFPMPVRYAMTLGELARMFNAENHMGADLHVVAMKDWRRIEFYDQTGLAWISPSPNLRTLREDFPYPGIEILQSAGVSVGRGTDTPFEHFGAPWIHSADLVAELDRRKIPGVSFAPTEFTPTDGLYKGEACHGVSLTVSNRNSFRSMLMGLEIIAALHHLYPNDFQIAKTVELLGSQSTVDQLERGGDPRRIIAGWSVELDQFRAMRRKYLLYH
jgi:uncharacterized protein YbbC (DUF1343 family)